MGSTTAANSSTNWALAFVGSGHSLRGFNIIKLSATLGGTASVATSAVPIFANTRSTSGICVIFSSKTF